MDEDEAMEKGIVDMMEIISRIKFKDRNFVVGWFEDTDDGKPQLYLQLQYMDADVETGEQKEQHGRKWHISRHATVSEIVQTALKAVLTSQEHIAREFFTYRGERVYGPHFDVEDLVELCKTGKLDVRPPKP